MMITGYVTTSVNNLPRVVVSQERVTDRQTDRQVIQQKMMSGFVTTSVNKLPRVVVSQERVTDRQTDG